MGRLRLDTVALTALLGLLTGLGPLSVDLYLPTLPEIGRDLAASRWEPFPITSAPLRRERRRLCDAVTPAAQTAGTGSTSSGGSCR